MGTETRHTVSVFGVARREGEKREDDGGARKATLANMRTFYAKRTTYKYCTCIVY